MRIGLLGGTFDPVHKGHIYLAERVFKKLRLDKMIFIPAHIPPHKDSKVITPAKHRVEMLKIALKNRKDFLVSDIEIKRKGRSYSVDTVRYFRKKHGKSAEIFFITGSDSLRIINKWKKLDIITKLCEFVVVKRPGFSFKNNKREFISLDIAAKNISSTDIRKKIKAKRNIGRVLPKNIAIYISRQNIYA